MSPADLQKHFSITDLQKHFIGKGWTLALAESCTGGQVAASIVQVPDSSKYFLGSLVVYSNSLKERILHVQPHIIETKGAVSTECAEALSQNLYKLTDATWCCSITGIAGPSGGSVEKPVGTVFLAFSYLGQKPITKSYLFKGDRLEIIKQSEMALIKELFEISCLKI